MNAGRDWLGDDHPREELNVIVCGRHHGWLFVHEEALKDPEYWDKRPRGVHFTPPVHTFAAHSTPLSIRFLRHQPDIAPGTVALIARHGSWNRSRKVGYDVVWLEFRGNRRIIHRPYVTGFLEDGNVLGRPVDVFEAPDGAIHTRMHKGPRRNPAPPLGPPNCEKQGLGWGRGAVSPVRHYAIWYYITDDLSGFIYRLQRPR